LGTNEEKELIRKAMLEPELELPSEIREEMAGAISSDYHDHQILNDNLKKHLGNISSNLDQNALSDEVFRTRLIDNLEKVQPVTDSSFFFKMRLNEFINNIREKMVYSQYAPYRWAPVGLVFLFIVGSIPLMNFLKEPSGHLAYKNEMKDWMGLSAYRDELKLKVSESEKKKAARHLTRKTSKPYEKKKITRIAARSGKVRSTAGVQPAGDLLEEDPNISLRKKSEEKKKRSFHPDRATLIKAKKSFIAQKNKDEEKKLLKQLKKAKTPKTRLSILRKLEKFYKNTSNQKKLRGIQTQIKKLRNNSGLFNRQTFRFTRRTVNPGCISDHWSIPKPGNWVKR